MTAINFSAHGTRWRAVSVSPETPNSTPLVPGPGLLFTSADGEIRFLPFDSAETALGELQAKTTAELGTLVQRASPLPR